MCVNSGNVLTECMSRYFLLEGLQQLCHVLTNLKETADKALVQHMTRMNVFSCTDSYAVYNSCRRKHSRLLKVRYNAPEQAVKRSG